jgi:hypothetical protein
VFYLHRADRGASPRADHAAPNRDQDDRDDDRDDDREDPADIAPPTAQTLFRQAL